ncbi:MAG TPA: hypothetical protein PKZ84_02395 [Anaerolineae bacterium]|nr:hypothetical protein [Anaerolineae bacterium]HQI83151.1 hypothetical protein [Anaerolineae bacterium]
MKRWMVGLGLGMIAGLTLVAPVAAQSGGDSDRVRFYDTTADSPVSLGADCLMISQQLSPSLEIPIGDCGYFYEDGGYAGVGTFNYKACLPAQEAGSTASYQIFVSYSAEAWLENPSTFAYDIFGHGTTFVANDVLDYSYAHIGRWANVQRINPEYPDVFFTQYVTGNVNTSRTSSVYIEMCISAVSGPTPTPTAAPEATLTPTPTPIIFGGGDYGQIGQIIDIDVGLGIVQKIVGYLGAANIRDYIAMGFALAAIVALFKAPSSSQ